jgi:hypothetical protein
MISAFYAKGDNMGDKDITEKQLEDYDDVFADIINVLLFDGKRVVDENDLEDVMAKTQFKDDGGKIHEQERDNAKLCRKQKVSFALFGLENQTRIDVKAPLRVISYDGASYKSQLLREEVNYPVITLVLYFGEEHWAKSTRLSDCVSVPTELESYFNDYKINVFEIAFLSKETIDKFTSDFKCVAEFFSEKRKNKDYVPDSKDTIRHIDEVLKLLSAVTGDNSYELVNKNSERKVTNMCEVAERLKNSGRAEGEAKGKVEVYLEIGLNVSDIADKLNLTTDEVQEIIDREHLA